MRKIRPKIAGFVPLASKQLFLVNTATNSTESAVILKLNTIDLVDAENQDSKSLATAITTIKEEGKKKGSTSSGSKNNRECEICGKEFISVFSCLRHKSNRHNIPFVRSRRSEENETKKKHRCDICSKAFWRPSELSKHKTKAHGIELPDPTLTNAEKKHVCSECNKPFSTLGNLTRHKKKVHQINSSGMANSKLKCSECGEVLPSKQAFTDHILEQHQYITMREEYLDFESTGEFQNWRLQMEKDTCSMYIRTHRAGDIYYFRCHRSGRYKGSGTGKRRLKAGGSNKTGFYCPARLRVKLEQGEDKEPQQVKVTFHSTHVGHDCDPGRLKQNSSFLGNRVKHSEEDKSASVSANVDAANEASTPPPQLAFVETIQSGDSHKIILLPDQISSQMYGTVLNDHRVKDFIQANVEQTEVTNAEIDASCQQYNAETVIIADEQPAATSRYKDEATSAILGFLPELEEYTTDEQFKEVIDTMTMLKHRCQEMSARRQIPPIYITLANSPNKRIRIVTTE